MFVIVPNNADIDVYRAMMIPLHIGVPLFVMISGYFGIKWSFRGLARLLSKAYILFAPLAIAGCVIGGNLEIKTLLQNAMVVGFNNLWFLNVYLYLFLVSPVINQYLKDADGKKRTFLLLILAFMNFYIGNITQSDQALIDGKNLTNFLFLYVVGNTLHYYQTKINVISIRKLTSVYVLTNIILVFCFMYVPFLAGKIWKYSFDYNSPVMYFNCIMVFIIFSKLNIKSRVINFVGGSIFACYLLQCPGLIWENVFAKPVSYVDARIDTPMLMFPTIIAYALCAMVLFVLIDKALNPIWKVISLWASRLDDKCNTKGLFA